MKRTIVVAKYKEDTSWTNKYDNVVIIEKDKDKPNVGREPASYIHYIIKNYDDLEGKYFFLQGNPYEHCPWVEDELEDLSGDFRWFSNRKDFVCDMMGQPHDNVDIKSFLDDIGLDYDDDTITFNGCCLFMLSAEKITQFPKSFYNSLYKSLLKGRNCYAFERLIGVIWNNKRV